MCWPASLSTSCDRFSSLANSASRQLQRTAEPNRVVRLCLPTYSNAQLGKSTSERSSPLQSAYRTFRHHTQPGSRRSSSSRKFWEFASNRGFSQHQQGPFKTTVLLALLRPLCSRQSRSDYLQDLCGVCWKPNLVCNCNSPSTAVEAASWPISPLFWGAPQMCTTFGMEVPDLEPSPAANQPSGSTGWSGANHPVRNLDLLMRIPGRMITHCVHQLRWPLDALSGGQAQNWLAARVEVSGLEMSVKSCSASTMCT